MTVDPATGIARATQVVAATDVGAVVNPTGALGQVTGGVVMALGNATLEGTRYGADGRQRNPSLLDYKLLTSADAPRIEAIFVENPASDGGPRGLKGVGEPPIVPTAGAVANAIAAATGARVRRLPMTPERVWRAIWTGDDGAGERDDAVAPAAAGIARDMTTRFAAPTTVSAALAILATDRDARPVAGGTDLVVAARQGRKALPESIVAIDRIAELQEARAEEAGLVLGALTTHAWLAADPDVRSWLDCARGRGRHRRFAGDARDRHDRRKFDERVAGGRDDRAARRARRDRRSCAARASASGGSPSRTWRPVPGGRPPRPASCSPPSGPRGPRRAAAAPTSGSSTGGRWRSPSSVRRCW